MANRIDNLGDYNTVKIDRFCHYSYYSRSRLWEYKS